MKKKIISLALILFIYSACKTKPDAADVKMEVLNIHDKLMIDGEKVIKNKMKLDSVLKSGKIKSAGDSTKLVDVINRLNIADENMMDWMHFFKDDFKGKNEQENLVYYKSEMVKIRAVEDRFIKVTKESDSLLKVYNISPDKNTYTQHNKH